MMRTNEKMLLVVQAAVVYLVAFVAGLIFFGALDLVFDIDVMRTSAIAASGASAWTIIAALALEVVKRKNEESLE